MERLQSIDGFRELQSRLIASLEPDVPTIVINAGTCGQASGANDLIRMAKRDLIERDLTDQVRLRITGCQGFCEMEPSLLIEPRRTFYPKVKPANIPRILEAVTFGKVVEELLYSDPATGKRIEKQDDIPFFKHQVRTILGRNEKVDPIRIYNYLDTGGYTAFVDILEKNDPLSVINEVKSAGLRGRGGAGFPTGLKWELLAKQPSKTKYLVCNADEGDPGAYMDRSVLEGNPHSILEGMLIGAFATGATEGVVYVRDEYPLAIKHLVIALRQARELGLLGDDILGTHFSFNTRIVRGAGAFVCGEETALMRSIEGKMGEPRQRPPYPVQKGVFGKPTAINNVETWANIPVIFNIGASEYIKVGTPGNTGTKIFSLVGKIRNTGLVEVPMGMPIQKIVNEIGGGPSGDAPIKAVQTGGPSGGCIPAALFDTPVEYDSLAKVGSIMGSGGMIVMDENTCMVDLAKYFMHFLMDESCGKCFTCRKGTQRMHEILDDVSKGKADLSALSLLEELAQVVKDTTMCGLGQSAPNPVLSTLKYFRKEFEQHILQKKCQAFVCNELVGAPCHAACPIGTEAWRYIAHISAGEDEQAYRVIRETNPFPSLCARVCDHKCESRCRLGTSGHRPMAIRNLKRFVTDTVDPSVYQPVRSIAPVRYNQQVAIIGAGPAGLTAAHYLSLMGYRSTVFEAGPQPGGMLFSCIPAYRLPRETLTKEINSLLDENVTFIPNSELGRDYTLDTLKEQGFKSIFVAIGAQKGRRLELEGEDSEGVFPSIEFLKAFNIEGKTLARGKVGVVGGGNSAVDAARTALRQPGVESVTIIYRRTREEMPAYEEEIQAAIEEGVRLEALVSPIRVLVTRDGKVNGIKCIRNRLGERDESGRARPVPIEGSEFPLLLDTLIVAISEHPDTDSVSAECAQKINLTKWGTIQVDPDTLATNIEGVFAGGDVVSGPNTVVDAIAHGKRAAIMIDRCLRGDNLKKPIVKKMPEAYVPPVMATPEELARLRRAEPPTLSVEQRAGSFAEVEMTLSAADAQREARRCLRCDLEFTTRNNGKTVIASKLEEVTLA